MMVNNGNAICGMIGILIFQAFLIINVDSFAYSGVFNDVLNERNNIFVIPNRGYYNNTEVSIRLYCQAPKIKVRIGWILRLSECVNEFYLNTQAHQAQTYYDIYTRPNASFIDNIDIAYVKPKLETFECNEHSMIDLKTQEAPDIKFARSGKPSNNKVDNKKQQQLDTTDNKTQSSHDHSDDETLISTWQDGVYLFLFYVEPDQDFTLNLTIGFRRNHHYLTANDWPFLPFYAVMCAVYTLFGFVWFAWCACYWRDLLRIQMWIGGVIILGLMEKAAYLAEYEEVNRSGEPVKIAVIIAEFLSCSKRSLSRMLVIVVSLGFGIVKPRLGKTMKTIVSIGSLYFVLSLIDSIFRIVNRPEDNDNKGALASVPLVFMDVSIGYWVLVNLQQTMKTLRVRRNVAKLTLYRHFTNTLIFCALGNYFSLNNYP
jgi:hypothetical protein